MQDCALHMFVMRGSIGNFAAAQQAMVLIHLIKFIVIAVPLAPTFFWLDAR
jgi:preprotein translocase subunit Sec63